jgi:hypothetical protein
MTDTAHNTAQAAEIARLTGTRVIRGGSTIIVDGVGYDLRDCSERSYALVVEAGSNNPAFDMPGWFFSGSPYAEQIKALGAAIVAIPDDFRPEWVPDLGKLWSSREAIWDTYCKTCPQTAEAERDAALARVAVMEEALHFYADFCETPNDGPWGVGSTDFGSVARAALKGGAEHPAKPPAKRDRGKMVRPAPGAPCGGYPTENGGAVCATPDPIMTKTHWKILQECYPGNLQEGGTAGEVWSDLLRMGYVAADPWGITESITEKGIAALKGRGE